MTQFKISILPVIKTIKINLLIKFKKARQRFNTSVSWFIITFWKALVVFSRKRESVFIELNGSYLLINSLSYLLEKQSLG